MALFVSVVFILTIVLRGNSVITEQKVKQPVEHQLEHEEIPDSQGCLKETLNKAKSIALQSNKEICMRYIVTKPDDIEVVVFSSYIQAYLYPIKTKVSLGANFTKQLTQRIQIFKKEEIIEYCSWPKESNSTLKVCTIKVFLLSTQNISTSLYVVALQQDIVFENGKPLLLKAELSATKGIGFRYSTKYLAKELIISTQSRTTVDLKLRGQVVKPGENPIRVHSRQPQERTGLFGHPALMLFNPRFNDICTNGCDVIIVVYAMVDNPQLIEFQILLNNGFIMLKELETIFDVIVLENIRNFTIQKRENQNPVVLISGNDDCAGVRQINQSYEVQQSNNSSTQIMYTLYSRKIDVRCRFQIAYSYQKIPLFQLIKKFKVQMKPYEKIHFLYYHDSPKSLRISSQSEDGSVKMVVTVMNKKQFKEFIQSRNINGIRLQTNQDPSFLTIMNTNKQFCSECFYLIQLQTNEKHAIFNLLAYTFGEKILAAKNQIIYQQLNTNHSQLVYFFKSWDEVFVKFPIKVFSGQINFKMTDELNNILWIKNISNFELIDLFQNRPPLSRVTFYIFKITAINYSIFTFSIVDQTNSMRLRQGFHYENLIKGQKQKTCINFRTLKSNQSTYLYVGLKYLTNINYSVNCLGQSECPKDKSIVLALKQTQQNLNFEFKSTGGQVRVCFWHHIRQRPTNISFLFTKYLHNGLLAPRSNYLIVSKHNQYPSFIEMKTKLHHYLLVELFQCQGDLEYSFGTNIDLLKQNIAEPYEHSRLGGHFLAKIDPKSQNIAYASINVKRIRFTPDAMFIFRYSWFEEGKFPYDMLLVESPEISYFLKDKQIVIDVPSVKSILKIIQLRYQLFISTDDRKLKSAVQCGTKRVYNKTIEVSPSDNSIFDEISFNVNVDDIRSIIVNEIGVFKAVAKCTILVESSKQNNTYTIIYNQAEISLSSYYQRRNPTTIGWVSVVFVSFMLLVLVCTGKYCIKWVIRYIPSDFQYIEDQKKFSDPQIGGAFINGTAAIAEIQKNYME